MPFEESHSCCSKAAECAHKSHHRLRVCQGWLNEDGGLDSVDAALPKRDWLFGGLPWRSGSWNPAMTKEVSLTREQQVLLQELEVKVAAWPQ